MSKAPDSSCCSSQGSKKRKICCKSIGLPSPRHQQKQQKESSTGMFSQSFRHRSTNNNNNKGTSLQQPEIDKQQQQQQQQQNEEITPTKKGMSIPGKKTKYMENREKINSHDLDSTSMIWQEQESANVTDNMFLTPDDTRWYQKRTLLGLQLVRKDIVNTRLTSELPTNSREWAESIIGREWELFWNETSIEVLDDEQPVKPKKIGKIGEPHSDPMERTEEAYVDTEQITTHHTQSDKMIGEFGTATAKATATATTLTDPDTLEENDITYASIVSERGEKFEDSDIDVDEMSCSTEFEEDWYDATVHSFEYLKTVEDGSQRMYFNVSFIGDKTMYRMVLSPKTTRPSARAWIRRSTAILKQSIQRDFSDPDQYKNWEASLPFDTGTSEDQESLKGIEQNVKNDFPVVAFAKFYKKDPDGIADFQRLRNEHENMCFLLCLVRSQLYHRTLLARIDDSDMIASLPDDSKSDEINPSEWYVDFLVDCLREIDQACRWHYKCWKLVYRLFADDGTKKDQKTRGELEQLTREFFVKQFLSSGRRTIHTFTKIKDISVKAAKQAARERKRLPPPSPQDVSHVSSRPSSARLCAKRKRKSGKYFDIWTASPSSESLHNEIEDEEVLLTSQLQNFIETVAHSDARWYSLCCGNMLNYLSCMVATPLVRWEQTALDLLWSDGKITSPDIVDEVDRNEDRDESSKRRLVKHEDIEMLLRSVTQNRALRCFDLSAMVKQLEQKLRAIESFEKRAWGLIFSVLDDPVKSSDSFMESASDPLMRSLQALFQEATSVDGPIGNVSPIGKSPSMLTREVLESAIAYRSMYLDVVYAESVRERMAFLESIVSRFSELPQLPLRNGLSDHDDKCFHGKLDHIAPRVRALSRLCMKNVTIFDRYQSQLNERVPVSRHQGKNGLLTLEGAEKALTELHQMCVISDAEEMLAVRIDTLHWEMKAKFLLSRHKPTYGDLKAVKEAADMILDGRSKTREMISRGKKIIVETESVIKAFGHSDLTGLCGPLLTQVATLYSAATDWKVRAESVLLLLQSHGHSFSVNVVASRTKPGNVTGTMVDLRRIEDLTDAYSALNVELGETYQSLLDVRDSVLKWSLSVTACLEDNAMSYEGCHAFMERAGTERPAGIIAKPTRQNVEVLLELLNWYIETKEWVSNESFDQNQLHALLTCGLPVIERFSRQRKDMGQFVVTSQSVKIIQAKDSTRKTPKEICLGKLETNPLTDKFIDRMTNESRDETEGYPLFCLLFSVWTFHVHDFLYRCGFPKESQTDISLLEAKRLQKSRPFILKRSSESLWVERRLAPLVPKAFDILISSGEKIEHVARSTLLVSKSLLIESSQQIDCVVKHSEKLKELYTDFVKSRWNSIGFVPLDIKLEQKLEHDVKVFGWLVRTFPYPALQSHIVNASLVNIQTGKDSRVPFEVLVSLHDRMPQSDLVLGDFACITLRVKELYAAAHKWNDDISNFTKLSLRGGKRRESTDDPDASATVDLEMVTELSNSPILSKVIMPREKGIRSIVINTQKFEHEFFDFLDKNYDGESPDRVAIPECGSLVDHDGTFLLHRLTSSPFFLALRASVDSISALAQDVLANTPGKAAFEWIESAFRWIDSIQAKFVTRSTNFGPRRLSIPGVEAMKLLKEAHGIFLELPDDLRKTLSLHRIFIAVTKDGKLTVKSLKGGAHYAVGATCIRWCPFLYTALKEDMSKLEAWESSVMIISRDFLSIREYAEGKAQNDAVILERCYGCRDNLAKAFSQVIDLTLMPTTTLVESCRTILSNITSFLQKNSTRDAAKKFIDTRFVEGFTVVEDRFQLLDSLLKRKAVTRGYECDFGGLDHDLSNQSHFRNAGRKLIGSALKKGATTLDLLDQTAMPFCEMKAAEIECALFECYQKVQGESQITPQYREKARAIRRSLEDPGNLSLCVNVLCGKLSPDELVSLSSDQLANPTMRRNREMAALAARQNAVLTGPSSNLASDQPTSKTTPIAPIAPVNEDEEFTINSLKSSNDNYLQRDSVKLSLVISLPTNKATNLKMNNLNAEILDYGQNSPSILTEQSPESPLIPSTSNTPSFEADDTVKETSQREYKARHVLRPQVSSNNDSLQIDSFVPSAIDQEDMTLKTHPLASIAAVKEMLPKQSIARPVSSSNDIPVQSDNLKQSPAVAHQAKLSPNEDTRLVKHISKFGTLFKTASEASRKPPPPPPSLVQASLKAASDSSSERHGEIVSNSTGGEKFFLSFADGGLTFFTNMYAEVDPENEANGFLPETLAEKGRLTAENFTKFMCEKMKGGRYHPLALRLELGSDKDTKEYVKFCKEYEGVKNRIAMFALNDEGSTKAFLVTPRYHTAAKGLKLRIPTSSYCIVLSKTH